MLISATLKPRWGRGKYSSSKGMGNIGKKDNVKLLKVKKNIKR